MKVEIVDARNPELKAGQLWEHSNGDIYLAAHVPNSEPGRSSSLLILLRANDFKSWWSRDGGFGTSSDEFRYIGELKITP